MHCFGARPSRGASHVAQLAGDEHDSRGAATYEGRLGSPKSLRRAEVALAVQDRQHGSAGPEAGHRAVDGGAEQVGDENVGPLFADQAQDACEILPVQ